MNKIKKKFLALKVLKIFHWKASWNYWTTHALVITQVDEEDCYAEILKDDIIKLDESSLSQEAHTTPQDPAQMHPCQGTANRRIRLVRDSGRSPEGRVRFPSSKKSSKNTSFFARMTNRLVVSAFLVFTLVAIFLFFIGGLKLVKYCGEFSRVKLWLVLRKCRQMLNRFLPIMLH